jgi:fatty-acyl-CoA synthase/long-chain acyl-CoA synthetase
MFVREIEEQKCFSRNLSSLRTGLIGGASLTAQLVLDIRKVLHCNVMVAYASTEVLAISMTNFDDAPDLIAASVGRAFDSVEVMVRNSEGILSPTGLGEVVCRGDVVMKGILNSATSPFDEQGWFATGDIVRIDEAGYLYVLGRKDDMIIRGGYNIFPIEISEFYSRHPHIVDVCVVGTPHPEWGEQICAAVILKSGVEENEDSLKRYASGKLPRNRIPDRILVVESFPSLANGKTDVGAVKLCFSAE